MSIQKPIANPHKNVELFLMESPFNYTRQEAQAIIDRYPVIAKKRKKTVLATFETLQKIFPLWAKEYFHDRPGIVNYSPETLTKRIDAFTEKKDLKSKSVQHFMDKLVPPWLHNIYYKGDKKRHAKKPRWKLDDTLGMVQIDLEQLKFSQTQIESILKKMFFSNPNFVKDFRSFETYAQKHGIAPEDYSREIVLLSLSHVKWTIFKKPLDFFIKNGADITTIKNYLKHSRGNENYSEKEMYAILNYMAYLGRDIRKNYLGDTAYTFFKNNNISLKDVVANYGPKSGEEMPKIEFKAYGKDVFFEVMEKENFSREQAAELWEKHGDIFSRDGLPSDRFAFEEAIQLLKSRNLTNSEIFKCFLKNKSIMTNTRRLLASRLEIIDDINALLGRNVLRQLLRDSHMKLINKNTITYIKKGIEINKKKKKGAVRNLIRSGCRYKAPAPKKIEKFSILNTGDAEFNEQVKNARTLSFYVNEIGGGLQ